MQNVHLIKYSFPSSLHENSSQVLNTMQVTKEQVKVCIISAVNIDSVDALRILPPMRMSFPLAAFLAFSSADSMPSITKWNTRSPLHADGFSCMVCKNEYRNTIGRVFIPPTLPLIILSRAANRSEHIASHDPRRCFRMTVQQSHYPFLPFHSLCPSPVTAPSVYV